MLSMLSKASSSSGSGKCHCEPSLWRRGGLQESTLTIAADEQRLRQIITILLDNATRYSEPDSAIDVLLSATAEAIKIQVKDYGSGISPADLQYIFERFVRFKPRTDGAGLGLSIARALVEAHHGEIRAESEQGQGSVFTVVIPRQRPI